MYYSLSLKQRKGSLVAGFAVGFGLGVLAGFDRGVLTFNPYSIGVPLRSYLSRSR